MLTRKRIEAIEPVICAVVVFAIATKTIHAQTCLTDGISYSTTDASSDDAPFAVITCDLDGDGDEDLATANDASDTVSVLLNDGVGSFGSLRRWAVGPAEIQFEPVDLACCDLNGDERLDLITVNHTSDDVSILYNAGNVAGVPQFLPAVQHAVGEAPWAVRCARIDIDAHVDIVTANFTSDSVSILLNDGQGGVSGEASYAIDVGGAPRSIALCDIDGDTDLDVVTGNMLGKSVTVLRNDGNAGLIDTGDVPLGVNPFSIACCELDGMTGADLVTANIIDDSIAVLVNDGSGSFGGLTRTGGSDGATGVACGDIDRDGTMDVVTANLGSDDMTIFRNTGGAFAIPQPVLVGTNPSSVSVGSLTTGGGSDIAVAFAGGVHVLPNTCGPTADIDGNGDADMADFAILQACMAVALPSPSCDAADVNGNLEVDLGDYEMFYQAFGGPRR